MPRINDRPLTFSTYRQALSFHAKTNPERACLIVDGQPMTWREVGLWAARLAPRLSRRDFSQKAKRAALVIDESTDFFGVYLGLIALGWAPIPVPDRLRAGSLEALLRDCAPQIVVASPGRAQALQDLYRPASVLVTSELPDTADRDPLADSTAADEPSPDDEMTIFYSSGTTGVPKGVLHSHRTLVNAAANAIQHYCIGENERSLVSAPIYTARALAPLLATVYAGGTSIVLQKFDVTSLLDCVRQHSPHTIDLVPTQFMMLIEDPRFDPADFACCRFILCGGAVLDPRLRDRLFELFPSNFVHVYGSSETSLISRLPRRPAPEKRASVGPPRGVEVRILGEDNEALSCGERGEIAVQSPGIFLRYVGHDASRDVFWLEPGTGKAFYRTGDMGWSDADGYLWLADRKKDMIITAGFKIYPVDMEAVLNGHPYVREAAVVGRPHAKLGETPVGFVTLKDRQYANAATRSQILRWANGRLNANQRLLDLRIIEVMPNTPSGKPMKAQLRQMATESVLPDSSAATNVPA